MKTTEINNTLIGRRVRGIFTGLKVEGSIIGLVNEEYSVGITIKLDRPVQWGDSIYKTYTSTARKSDGWGNLEHTELID